MANGPAGGREYAAPIESLLDAGAWAQARWWVRARLGSSPHDHWLWAQLALTLFGEGRAEEALGALSEASLRAPRCPLVLWYRAAFQAGSGAGETARSAGACRALLELGPEVAHGDCGLGTARARALLSEATRRLACIELNRPAEPAAPDDVVTALRRLSPPPLRGGQRRTG